MSLKIITHLNVDFYDKKYILINAKQYDSGSRYILITCYNHGEIYPINANEHSAYVRYKKSDNQSVFNFCEIDLDGKILIELTEQMLARDGICYVDLVIVTKGNAEVNADTGEITAINNSAILSTMTFCIDVSQTAVENSEIESSYEFNAFNETLKKYEAYYQDVITAAKSWAEGGTGIRDDEDIHNAKYWAEIAHLYVLGDLDDKIVTGVKGEAEEDYRVGFVTLTPENIGAIPNADIATVDETKSYLGI